MSVSSLPEWKQLLLEKKRREEEERERREQEEEKKFASMPAWKRGIIQRRKAKQDSLGDREKERDMCLLQVDVRSASDGLSDSDSFVTVNLGSETSLSPDAGLWLEGDLKVESQVSLETIVPVHENPFIRTQSAWRKGRDAEGGNEVDVKEKEKDKLSPRGQDGESGRGRDIELKIERFRDTSEGRDKERSRDRSQGRDRENGNQWKDRELLRGRRDEEERETDLVSGSFSPHVPCLRTIRADNIIIIEQERKTIDERRSRWKETERPEEDHQGHRGVKMDLREILAGGGSITEIRASEVLIIKPSAGPEEGGRGGKGLGREDGEIKCSVDGQRPDLSWLRDKEKERPWGQATVIKDDRKDSLDDNVFVEKGGRVSQLVSKFGQHPKPPSRSKSSDNFLRPGRKKYSGDEDDQQSEADWRNMLLKGVPKRSFSFSDRVICAKENGLNENERKTRKRGHSDRSAAPWVDVTSLEKETTAKIKLESTRFLDKDGIGKPRDGHLKKKDEKGAQRRNDADVCISIQQRGEVKKAEPIDMRAAERPCDADGDEGFTVASVKNTEGISFARRVAIKQDGKTRTEREVKRQTGEKSLERETNAERDSGGRTEVQVCDKKVSEEGFKSTITPGNLQKSHVESAFPECSGLLCAVSDRVPHRVPERSGAGPPGPHLVNSVLSQHTEELISIIEKIGDTTVYSNEKGERAYRAVYDLPKGPDQDEVTLRSPKRTVPIGIAPGPLEIQIPRSVFYVAEEMAERKRGVGQEGQDWEGGKGVERRDSWRIGKPLSRVESLREKIRQRELERLKQTQGEGGSEAAEINNIQTAVARPDERGSELENEWEAAALTRKRLLEVEKGQEDAAAQASEAAFDVTQEVSVLKSCSQIPVSVLHSQANRGEEVTGGYAAVASEVIYDQISDDENDPLKHVEEELRRHRAQHQNRDEERGEQEEEEELSEEEIEENTSPLNQVQSLSPSSPHPNTLAAMSRIYNLETVGSRSGLCLRERTVDIPSVHLVKVRPLVASAQQGDGKTLSGEDISGVQTIQRQIEQFQLREQEKLSLSPNTLRKDREAGQQSPRGALKHQRKGDTKTTEKDQEASESSPKASPLCVLSPTSQLKHSNQTAAVTPSLLRSQSPDNTLKPDWAPTPAPSPSSPSPAQSPSISPSPTPSPTLFSIRSASGGQVKRGTTFTITPKKPAGGGGVMGSTAAASKPPKTSSQQAQTTSSVAQPAKKKYPTVEEIEVIGGYQNLDKSCLVKNKGTPRRGKVCFDEDQLEQVCEYPSESSMLVSTPYPQDLWRQQGEEAQEEEEEVEVSVSTRSAVGGGVRVGQRHPLLKRHNV